MAKRRYMSPLLLTITPDDPTPIVIGGSTGTHGEDSPFSFNYDSFYAEFGDDAQDMIDTIILSCDDGDLTAMDTNGDYVITYAEYAAWSGE